MGYIKLHSETLPVRFLEYANIVLCGGYNPEQFEVVSKTFAPKPNESHHEFCLNEFASGYGLAVFGNPGSGKTFLFKVLQKILPPDNPLKFRIVETHDLVSRFNAVGDEVFKAYKGKNVCFNDLGFEKIGVRYGDKMEVMEQFIHIRMDEYENCGTITHFTSNLSKQQIVERYGMRIWSRIESMCTIVKCGASSEYSDYRKLKNLKLNFPPVYFPVELTPEQKQIEAHYEWLKNNPPPKYEGKGEGIGTQLRNYVDKVLKNTNKQD